MNMMKPFVRPSRTRVTPGLLGRQIWDVVQRLYVDWENAVRMQDLIEAARVEQEIRFFVLVFASLPVDRDVTTGRKAIVRAFYERLGSVDTVHVTTMLDAVIAREEATARNDVDRLKAD